MTIKKKINKNQQNINEKSYFSMLKVKLLNSNNYSA